MKARNHILAALLCFFALPAQAVSLDECQAKEKAPVKEQLTCWKDLAVSLANAPADTENKTPSSQSPDLGNKSGCGNSKGKGLLLSSWDPCHDGIAVAHKQNYFLVTHTANPNHKPSSPNPISQTQSAYSLNELEAKFQISGKVGTPLGGKGTSLWLGYTQQSHWQVFDGLHSSPFRENNYDPEIIISHRFDKVPYDLPDSIKILNLGLEHQSNGQGNPRSRSWNRVYIQPGIEFSLYGGSLALLPRIWARISEKNAMQDDNPDIDHYLGNAEMEVRYLGKEKYQLTALARSRSVQVDAAIPIPKIFKDLYLHIQGFSGYGESLIDYNHRHTTWGIGLSLPYIK